MHPSKTGAAFLAFSAALFAAKFQLQDVGRIVRLSDPQIAPDGKSVALIVSRANFEENRYDPEVVQIDIATRVTRPLTHDRRGVGQLRWSPDGSQLAFLATVEGKAQIFLLPANG